ncbi:MAG: hypothetical protein LBJ92_01325 [Holosporales bacterium]|jgi:gas vesicle protein|nr:hypothetical protein [Holosporales bacterium]
MEYFDTRILGRYSYECRRDRCRKEESRYKLDELTNRRCQIVKSIMEEKSRLEKEPSDDIAESIRKHMRYLDEEQEDIEARISEVVGNNASIEDKILRSGKGYRDVD